LKGVAELITVSRSGHRSKQRPTSIPKPQISPPRSEEPTAPGTKPTTRKQLRQLQLNLATPAVLLRLAGEEGSGEPRSTAHDSQGWRWGEGRGKEKIAHSITGHVNVSLLHPFCARRMEVALLAEAPSTEE
jgi:hypothetical protein